MSLAFAMAAFGVMLIYAGWTNRSVWALASGDNTVFSPTPAASPSSTPTTATQTTTAGSTAGSSPSAAAAVKGGAFSG
jgi:hypothetical protein